MSKRLRRARRRNRRVGLLQGVVYVATGLWPVLSIATFERVTGPKKEDWLVRTVGGLIAVVGVVLARPALVRRHGDAPRPRPDRLLGAGSALTLGGASIIGVASGRLRPVYLLDAALEGLLVLAWLLAGRDEPGQRQRGERREARDGGPPKERAGNASIPGAASLSG